MAPRSDQANEQIKDKRRNQILLAALKIFTRKGFSAAKMSDIAGEVGISYGLVYHYFQSKEDVYTVLIRHAVESIGNVIEEIHSGQDEPVEQIRKIACRVIGSIEKKEASGYYYVLVMNALTCETIPVPADRIIKESTTRLHKLSDIISQGQQKGQIRQGDPMDLAVTCFSAVIGLAMLKVSGTIQTVPDFEILMRLF